MGSLSAVFRLDGGRADPALLAGMHEVSAYRGTLGQIWCDESLALAQRRGPDPLPEEHLLHDETGDAVVLTGRLYNQVELLRRLRAEHAPGPTSQVATLLACYRAWGPDFVEHLDGDFAFVLYDARLKRLLCAVDAVGIKSLHYALHGRCFLAATEPKQLLSGGLSAEPCEEAIADFLAHEVHLIGGPRTFYREILRLEPGHLLLVDADGVRTHRHWTLDPHRTLAEQDPAEMAVRVRELMEDSVRRRVPEKPPFGCALSGGFDSSSVLALLRRHLTRSGREDPIESFSFEFRTEEADESAIIAAVSRELDAHHHSVYVDEENIFDHLPAIIRAVDGPAYDLGMLVLWCKKRRVGQLGVPTILSGLGGDELFLGGLSYFADLFRAGRLWSLWREIDSFHPLNRTTWERTSRGQLLRDGLLPLLPRQLKRHARQHIRGEPPFGPWVRRELAERTGLAERIRRGSDLIFPDAYRRACYELFHHEMRSAAIPIHAALGAPVGVETRFPLLDRRLVEYMFAAPRDQKIGRGDGRWLQRRAMDGILPSVVLERHVKKNFNTVLARQQRQHFHDALVGLLDRKQLLSEDFVDWEHVRTHYRSYLDGGVNAWYPLFQALNVEWWMQQKL